MLVRFVVENFRSFKDEVVLSMVASKDDRHPEHTAEFPDEDHRLLRTAAIYGANASGKSNLAKALLFARNLITNGTRGDASIGAEPFAIDPAQAKKNTRFEFLVAWEGVLYDYGLVFNTRRVEEEWLYVTANVREQPYFERTTDPNGKALVEISHALARKGSKDYQRLQFVAEGTRPNQPFLTEMGERNEAAVKPLLEWFRAVLTIVRPHTMYTGLGVRTMNDGSFAQFLQGIMRVADVGISGVRAVRDEQPLNLEKRFPGMPGEVAAQIADQLAKGQKVVIDEFPAGQKVFLSGSPGQSKSEVFRVKTVHAGPSGEEIEFDFAQESDGTRRLAHLAPAFFDAKASPRVYFVDELDRSLHPLLTRLLIEMFLRMEGQAGQSQVIFTTHDTNLLDLNLLRRDEIWFMEKDRAQATRLYSLAEYRPRADLRLEKNYLQGRFGAIPFIGNLTRLGDGVETRSAPATAEGSK